MSSSGLIFLRDCSTETADVAIISRSTSINDIVNVVDQSTDTQDLVSGVDEISIDDFVGYSVEDELGDIFDSLIDHRFPDSLTGDRRVSFNDYVRSFSSVYMHLRVVYPNGVNWLMNIPYFIMYNFLSMLNRQRGRFLDDDLIRRNVVLLLSECANNNFNLLYELIFD